MTNDVKSENYYFQVYEDDTIIKILDEIAKGTFEKGSTFMYEDKKWVYDGEDIHTEEQDYYGGDYKCYLYLSEVIDLKNLKDKVTNVTRQYTITNSNITTATLNMGENTSVTKAKPDSWHLTGSLYPKSVHCCPVCGGRGFVASGFYSSVGNTWPVTTTAPDQCRTCGGKGYIEV